MKKVVAIISIICLLISSAVAATAEAGITPYSDECFRDAKVAISSSGRVTFTATLKYRCSTVEVTSCILQKKIGDNWTFAETLTVPESAANTMRYSKSKDYSSNMTSGVSYRVVAVFNADGTTRTATSGAITY